MHTTLAPIPLSLHRTAQALAAYDKHNYSGDVETPTYMSERERLSRILGEAFAQDTADRNRPDTARLMKPADPWLRKMVQEYGKDTP